MTAADIHPAVLCEVAFHSAALLGGFSPSFSSWKASGSPCTASTQRRTDVDRKVSVSRNLKVLVDESEQVEVDFGWPNVNVALEVSPFFTHGSRAKQERDARRRRLLAGVRWHVVEALDDDIASERAFARTITTLRALGAT